MASKSGLGGADEERCSPHRFDRIRINGVNIGWTITEGEEVVQRTAHGATDGWLEEASAKQPMGKLGQPDEIADFIVYLLSDRSGVVTGSIIDWTRSSSADTTSRRAIVPRAKDRRATTRVGVRNFPTRLIELLQGP